MEILTIALPYKTAYAIASGEKSSFALTTKCSEVGRILIFSDEEGDAERPALSTVAWAHLDGCRWNGNRYIYKLSGVVPLVPHFPVKLEDVVVKREVPSELVEFYPSRENIQRWLKSKNS